MPSRRRCHRSGPGTAVRHSSGTRSSSRGCSDRRYGAAGKSNRWKRLASMLAARRVGEYVENAQRTDLGAGGAEGRGAPVDGVFGSRLGIGLQAAVAGTGRKIANGLVEM
nr:hypothetical protein CFP56_56598 [Quercus suber]